QVRGQAVPHYGEPGAVVHDRRRDDDDARADPPGRREALPGEARRPQPRRRLSGWGMSAASSPRWAWSVTPVGLRERFRRLVDEWKEQSRYLSDSRRMAMLPSYQRIIGMGLPAVPLILEELRGEPDHWFWALEAITEENPVPAQTVGKVRQMA